MTSLIAVAVPVVTAVFLILTLFAGTYRGVNSIFTEKVESSRGSDQSE